MQRNQLQLKRLNGPDLCKVLVCPAVFETNRDTVVVQGQAIGASDASALTLGPGEKAVEVPREIFVEAARTLLGVA